MRREDDIAAGDMTQSIALYSPVRNASGDEIVSWALIVAGVAAEKRSMQGRETRDAGRDTSEQLVQWGIRYRTGIDTATRLTHAGSNYDILAIDDPTGNRRRLNITAKLVR